MKLFDIVGGKVSIHADFLAIPPMRRYWESTEDKQHANNVLSFIILCDYWDSPYVKSMNDDIREIKLKEELFKDKNYTLTLDEQLCRDEYANLLETRNLKMLNAMRNKIDTVSSYYEESIGEELDEKRIKDLLAGMEKVKAVFQTVDFLEKAVKAEELDNTKIRGNAQLNPYEIA